MKNLSPLPRTKYYYDKIVAAKNAGPAKTRLQALAPQIGQSYADYHTRARADQLHLYNATGYPGADEAMLGDCYGETAEVIKLKEAIRRKQPKHLRYHCNYCMIDNANSFDHYLPQSLYPEFSVLSINLLPACESCNKKKLNVVKNAANDRIILNFYYDPIPNLPFLRCTLQHRVWGVLPVFSLHNPGIPAPTYRLIERHFNRLGLIKRIHKLCGGQVYDIGRSIQHNAGVWTTQRAVDFLLGQAVSEKQDYGVNYCWAILKETLAGNAAYMASIGFP